MSDDAKAPMQSKDPVTVVHNGVVMHSYVDSADATSFRWKLNDGPAINVSVADEGKTWARGHLHSLDAGALALLKQAMTPAVAAPTTK